MVRRAVWFALWLGVMFTGAFGCCCSGEGKPRKAIEAERPYTRDDLMRMLRATPELYSKLSGYNKLLGEGDSIETVKSLDDLAQKYGYTRYSEFAIAYTRITNAATYIRMLEKGGRTGTIQGGDGSQKLLGEDARLILPYVEDVERVVKEARAASRHEEGR
jgi:hypothetical protein